VLTQTRRHSYIVSLLGIRHVVLAVNKMDAVGYAKSVFDGIVADYRSFASAIGLTDITCIPMSALRGENITSRSTAMPWYAGEALMEHLESVQISDAARGLPFRLPVQWVNRPNQDFRGFAGQIASGHVAVGERIRTLPSGKEAKIDRIVTQDGDLEEAVAGQSVTLTLDREIDISRGDLITSAAEPAAVADQFEATVIWMHEDAMLPGRQYLLKLGTRTVTASLTAPKHKVNVNTLEQLPARQLELNEIGVCNLTLDRPVAFDPYRENRETGGFILIDKLSNDTVGAGLLDMALRRADNIHWQALDVNRAARSQLKGQRASALWFTGLSGSGKSTIANLVEKRLHALGRHTYMLDGDNVRHGLNKDLGFTDADRVENIRRVAEVTRLMVDAGLIVLVSFISPFRSERRMARELLEAGEFIEIFIDTPLEVAEKRDPKGLYRKARRGELPNFTGIDSPYEAPEHAEITIRTTEMTPEAAAEHIINELDKAGIIAYAYNNPLAGL
jgi:bifunctional enzyme CysN/CysC